MEMEKYLIEDLGVPGDRIQCLLGTEPYTSSIHPLSNYARRSLCFLKRCFYQTMGLSWKFPDNIPTRENIIDTLLSLSTNSQIRTGDNIIIYFAGYGSRYSHYNYRNISGWRSYINALCPIDRTVLNNCEVPDISDLEMDNILTEISRTKGHRITFILDSCHCAGVTKDFGNTARYIRPLRPRDDPREAETVRQRDPEGEEDLRCSYPDSGSHVLLAACGQNECTEEVMGISGYNGIFTQALICALKSYDLTRYSTYTDLIRACKLPPDNTQWPVVAGKHKDARLWYSDLQDLACHDFSEGLGMF